MEAVSPSVNSVSSVAELLQALVRIPSVNPHGDPGVAEPGEQACAEAVGAFLERCGARVEYQSVLPGRPNVIGRFPTDRPGKPRLVFAPHLDTVSVVGMTIDPFAAELREGKIWGRGASDTKGPMAAMLWALYEMRAQLATLSHEIWFAGLMGEEAGQDGAYAFVREHRADFAIIGEPTECDIVHTHKGALWLTMTTRGKAVHASRPEDGENAIYKMMELIRALRDDLAPELAAITHPILGHTTMSVGTIRGGTKTNIVPDHCTAEVDFRLIPSGPAGPAGPAGAECPDIPSLVTERLRALVPDVEFTQKVSRPLYTAPDHPMIARLESLGAKCVGAPWFCDAAIFAQAGIPAIALGPGSIAQAHTKDEWIAVTAVDGGTEFFQRFLSMLK